MNKRDTSKQILSSDFTFSVMRAATTAKKRQDNRQKFTAAIKEPISMKSLQFLKTTPGLVAIFAVLATGSVSAYALTNWFGADVPVTQKGNILHVDLSECKATLPAGVPADANKQDVQYKITGTPHLSASQLQDVLLGSCESDAVRAFYAQKLPQTGFTDYSGIKANDARLQYSLVVGKVISTNSDSVTLNYSLGAKGTYDQTKTFELSDNATVFSKSQPVALNILVAGDQVEFVAYAAGFTSPDETNGVTDQANVKVLSIFKTQYDVKAGEKVLDAQNNLTPIQ